MLRARSAYLIDDDKHIADAPPQPLPSHTMASALRSPLLRQSLPTFRPQQLPRIQRAVLSTTQARRILPPLPQKIEGNVNDPARVPDPEPGHGSYHWTAER